MPDNAAHTPPSQEIAFLDHVERLDKHRAGRLAVHIRLSRLARRHQRDHYIRMAADMFENSVKALDGQMFALKNNDLVFVARGAPFPALDRAVNRLRALFGEDPIFEYKDQHPETFCSWYRLDTDFEALREDAREALRIAEQADIDYNRPDPTLGLTPIRADLLARLEQNLAHLDVTNMARRQTVCTMIPGQAPQALFEEIYVSIADLQARATPGVDLLADPWLFQYLTQTLDKRLMATLIRNGVPADRPFSINLNVASILSPDFRRFDEIVTPQLRGRLVIELNKLDVFADMGAYLFARDYLHERGFRLCLDGLTHLTLPYYDRARLGFDLIKIHWTPDSIDDVLPEMMPGLHRIVMEAGQARTILTRCETQRAVEIGQQLGIVMFQGRFIDRAWAARKAAPSAAGVF
jgi:EAL domain-containing protein (putative c-di-GMP-specific phosphodiesterase class I)